MNERIEIGDVVVVVRWPCCGSQLGHIDCVVADAGNFVMGTCRACGQSVPAGRILTTNAHVWPAAFLRKIPPLSELERTNIEQEVTA